MTTIQQKSRHDAAEGIATIQKKLSATVVKNGGQRMQRHMDLIQKILDQTEQRTEREPQSMEIEGYSDLVIGQHVELLFDAGYLVGIPYEFATLDHKHIEIRDLSWEGHEFLAVLRSDHGWGKVKKSFEAADLAKMPLKIIEAASTAALKHWVFEHMHLPM
jgi:glutaredoxin 2